ERRCHRRPVETPPGPARLHVGVSAGAGAAPGPGRGNGAGPAVLPGPGDRLRHRCVGADLRPTAGPRGLDSHPRRRVGRPRPAAEETENLSTPREPVRGAQSASPERSAEEERWGQAVGCTLRPTTQTPSTPCNSRGKMCSKRATTASPVNYLQPYA